jgi:hypothetical protein
MVRLTAHVRQRMTQRGITEADVVSALSKRMGGPQSGNRPSTMAIRGYATGGRLLKVIVSAADEDVIVTAFWEDPR